MTLTLDGVEAWRGATRILHDVDLSVAPGEMVGIFGRNGAGKSTLIEVIHGTLAPKQGRVVLDGHDLAALGPTRRARLGLATVEEGRSVFADLTVAENLRVAAPDGFDAAADLFPELAARATVRAGDLSGGEQQMVALARALVTDPHCLVVDEMSIGLAPTVVQRLITALRQVADSGVAVVVVDQFARTVAPHCDRSHLLVRGSLTEWDCADAGDVGGYFG